MALSDDLRKAEHSAYSVELSFESCNWKVFLGGAVVGAKKDITHLPPPPHLQLLKKRVREWKCVIVIAEKEMNVVIGILKCLGEEKFLLFMDEGTSKTPIPKCRVSDPDPDPHGSALI